MPERLTVKSDDKHSFGSPEASDIKYAPGIRGDFAILFTTGNVFNFGWLCHHFDNFLDPK